MLKVVVTNVTFVAHLTFVMTDFRFDQSFGRILGVAYTLVYKELGKQLQENELPLTPEQFRILSHLWQQDGCCQQELANYTYRDRANITRILDILERDGFVERKSHESDRRAFRIYLTTKAKMLHPEAVHCGKNAIAQALADVDPQDLEVCIKVLHKCIENLSK